MTSDATRNEVVVTGMWPAALAVFTVSLRALLTGRRWLIVGTLVGVYVALSVVLAAQPANGNHPRYLAQLFRDLGIPAMIPFIALLFSTEALGAEVEDRTLIYLTLRPLPSAAIVLAKFAAAAVITTGAVWVALIASLAVLVSGAPAAMLPALIVAAVAGSMGYCAVFLLAGLLLRRALLIGAGYVLVWEAAFGGLSTTAAHLSVRFYTLGVFAGILGRDDLVGNVSWPGGATSVVALLLVGLGALAICAIRLRRLELK